MDRQPNWPSACSAQYCKCSSVGQEGRRLPYLPCQPASPPAFCIQELCLNLYQVTLWQIRAPLVFLSYLLVALWSVIHMLTKQTATICRQSPGKNNGPFSTMFCIVSGCPAPQTMLNCFLHLVWMTVDAVPISTTAATSEACFMEAIYVFWTDYAFFFFLLALSLMFSSSRTTFLPSFFTEYYPFPARSPAGINLASKPWFN